MKRMIVSADLPSISDILDDNGIDSMTQVILVDCKDDVQDRVLGGLLSLKDLGEIGSDVEFVTKAEDSEMVVDAARDEAYDESRIIDSDYDSILMEEPSWLCCISDFDEIPVGAFDVETEYGDATIEVSIDSRYSQSGRYFYDNVIIPILGE